METQSACLAKWQGVKYTFTPARAASYVDREVLQSVGRHEAHLHSDKTNDIEKGCFGISFTDFKMPFISIGFGFCVVSTQTIITMINSSVILKCTNSSVPTCLCFVFQFLYFQFCVHAINIDNVKSHRDLCPSKGWIYCCMLDYNPAGFIHLEILKKEAKSRSFGRQMTGEMQTHCRSQTCALRSYLAPHSPGCA